MRTIKFRGQSLYTKHEWLYGDLAQRGSKVCITPIGSTRLQIIDYVVIPETVGQFTGYYDRNGVEIYEGDICEVEYYTNITTKENHYLNQVVEINGCDYVLKSKVKPISECSTIEICCHINSLNIIHRNDFNRIKVIGNIYENPELL